MTLEIKTRLLGKQVQTIKTALIGPIDKTIYQKQLYLKETSDGYQLQLGKDASKIVWKEDSLTEKAAEMNAID